MRLREERIDRNAVIDLQTPEGWKRLRGDAKLVMVDHLIWEIDKEKGKRGILIELEIPEKNLRVNFVPSHEFCAKFLDWMLEAEWLNDQYQFKKPSLSTRRPPKLKEKITRIEAILNKWKQITGEPLKHLHELLK